MSIPFSNLEDASVLRPNFLDVALIFSLAKLAPSINIEVVVSFISEFSPPIIPAKSKVLSWFPITNISDVKVLSTPSNVVNFSPSSAILTVILLYFISSKSNAWSGCPSSNIT